MNKRGVIELPLQWIMIIIIGIAFLIFFGQMGFKLSKSLNDANERLFVLNVKNVFLDASYKSSFSSVIDLGLDGREIVFEGSKFLVEKDKKLVSSGKLNQFIFGDRLNKDRVIVWSLPFELPFKVANFVFVSDDGFKFDVIDGMDVGIRIKEGLKERGFEVENGKSIKFVESNDGCSGNSNFDLVVSYVDDEIVYGKVCFYENGNLKGEKEFITEEMIYGAIFSNFEVYDVLYDRVIDKLLNVAKIYDERIDNCKVSIDFGEINENNIILTAKKIKELNKERVRRGCDYAY